MVLPILTKFGTAVQTQSPGSDIMFLACFPLTLQTGAMSIFLVSVIWLQSWLSAFDNVYPVVGQALASVVDGQWEWNLQLILRFFIVPPLWDTHSLVAFL
ncbi:Adenylosuccinate lyase [Trichinella pseudospiralis]